jgi:DeoR family suf operon transcriptional repressor
MARLKIHGEFFESSRGRIIDVLRRGGRTVDDIAAELRVTSNAVRLQLASLERDGLVMAAGTRPGPTRPSRVYELTPELEHLLSRAYIPLLTELVRVFAARESPDKFDRMMREAGRGLATELSPGFPAGTLDQRIMAASQLLNRELGATTTVEKLNGDYAIKGRGCPLAALTGKHAGVCHAMESMLRELLETRVRECCDRSERPRCCFEISPVTKRSRKGVGGKPSF